jgi:hypothetical protein
MNEVPGPGPVAHYATRNDAFSRPVTWTLAGAELRCDDGAGPPRVIAPADLAEVRLEYAPTRAEPNRFRCRLGLRSGEAREFFNRTCAGVLDFRDTSAEYAAFVRALHAALARHAPVCRFVAGASPARYAASVIATGFAALMVVVAALFLVFNGLAWLILLKLALMAIFLPNVFRWLARNRPCAYAPDAIPPEVLPRGAASRS